MKIQKTNNGKKGGLLKGKRHYDKDGNSIGGIKAIVTDSNNSPVELEGGEVIINREASRLHWRELSEINQSAGNGVPILPPSDVDTSDSPKLKHGGVTGDVFSIKDPEQFKQIITLYNKFSEKFNVDNYFIDDKDNSVVFLRKVKFKPSELKEMSNYIADLSKNQNFNIINDKQPDISNGYFKFFLKEKVKYGQGGLMENEPPADFENVLWDKLADRYDKGGNLTDTDKEEIYKKWADLVNMTSGELKKFMDSEEGKKAGLSKEQADKLGIHYGRQSARWILRMKATPRSNWTPTMWEWANRQISFNSRMIGNQGALYDDKGNKTRKHLSLLIWGHNPEKYNTGGNLNYHLGGDMSKHLAPNGKPSNLTHEQWHLVRTPEFKAWFGDFEKAYETGNYDNVSQVKDSNGEPLIVYHGTKKEFNVFDKKKIGSNTDEGIFGKGFYFSKNFKTAQSYGDYIKQIFLNIKNPLNINDFTNKSELAEHLNIDESILKEGGTGISAYLPYTGIFSDAIKEKKYDGVTTRFGEFVAFEPNQIKLADGTNTTFDTNNPDIRFDEGGNIKTQNNDMEKPKIGNVYGDLVLDRLEKAYKQRFPNDKFEREALIKIWNETKNERSIERANSNLTDIYLSYFDSDLRAIIYSDIQKEAKELEKGIAVEQEHRDTLEKVAAGNITPEQAIVETAQEHIDENPNYYDELEKIEKPKIKTMEQTKIGNDDWAKIPAQNKYATPVISKSYQYSPYDKTFQKITENFTGSDVFRPVYSTVNFSDKGICVTDAHKLLYLNHISEQFNGNYCVTPNCVKLISKSYDKDIISDDKLDAKYPDFEAVIPSTAEFVYDVDLLALKTYCEIVIRSGFVNKTTNKIALTFNNKNIIAVNGKFLIEACESFLLMGHRKVKVGITSRIRALLFVADNNYDGTYKPVKNSDFFLIMPVMDDEYEFNFEYMQGDIDFDNLLNIAYSLEKDAVITKGGEVFHKIDTSITKKDIKDAGELDIKQLQIASSFIKSSKNRLPILDNVLVKDKTMYLSNLEISYSISNIDMPDGVYEIRGTALFPAKHEMDDFPKMPEGLEKVGTINRQEFIKLFEYNLDFVGDDVTRELLTGVNFVNEGTAVSQQIVIQATDAYAGFRKEISNVNIDKVFDIIIGKPKTIYKILESFDCDEIDFYLGDKYSAFECGAGKVYFRTIDGVYPKLKNVYAYSVSKKIFVDSKDLKDIASEMKKVAKSGGYEIDDLTVLFDNVSGGKASYQIFDKEVKLLASGEFNLTVKDLYVDETISNFHPLFMPKMLKDKQTFLGMAYFNIQRLIDLGFENLEIGYNAYNKAVYVLNKIELGGTVKVSGQKAKKKEVKPIIEPIIESKPEVIVEDSAEVKEWKEAIENLNMLIDLGGSEAEISEWREAIDNLNMLIEMETSKMAIKGGIDSKLPQATNDELKDAYKVYKGSYYGLTPKKALFRILGAISVFDRDYNNPLSSEISKELNRIAKSYKIQLGIESEVPKMATGGGVDVKIPPQGTMISKDKKNKIDYKKVGNNYELIVYEGEPNAVENYSRTSFKKKTNGLVTMNYNQFINYIYTEGYVDNKMEEGGYIENENALMVANNNKQIYHHTKEMAEILKGAKNVPAWVVAKVNRSASDLSDATHYMEGAEGKYADGGLIQEELPFEEEDSSGTLFAKGGAMNEYKMAEGGKLIFKPITTPL